MPQKHGLGVLEVGVAGQDHLGVRLGLVDYRGLQGFDQPSRAGDFVLHEQADIRRDLIVSAAGGVQPAGWLAYLGEEQLLDVHVNVFRAGVEFDAAHAIVAKYRLKTPNNVICIGLSDDPTLAEHPCVRDAAGDVVDDKARIEGYRLGKRLHGLVRRLGESSAPEFV